MNIVEKINRSRYNLKEILSNEWDTDIIHDLSDQEIEKMYTIQSSNSHFPGVAAGCNLKLQHRFIPGHSLHIIYYNFPEVGRLSSKVTKSACDKLYDFYNNENVKKEDSLFIIINDTISESLSTSFDNLNIKLQNDFEEGISKDILDEMKENDFYLEQKHFRNVHLFGIDSFTNNLLKHRLVPEHIPIRSNKEVEKILKECNCNKSQLPIILKNDIVSRLIRLANGDICKILRTSDKCGEYPFYRICR
jgi:DNA-directed RNA polymerase subunit H (RpoH/RPB5)|tara:strand:- start:419 stop:1162 length:744 start_codon:yes stop_codon:yes gene_type:complete